MKSGSRFGAALDHEQKARFREVSEADRLGGPDGEQVGAVAPGWPEPLTPPKFSKPFSQCPGE